jgi:hypothetical protein
MYKPPLLMKVYAFIKRGGLYIYQEERFIHLSRGEVNSFFKRGGLYIYQEGMFIHLSRGDVYTFIKRGCLYKCINIPS